MTSKDPDYGSQELEYIDYKPRAVKDSTSVLKNSPIAMAILNSITSVLNEQQTDLIWLTKNMLNLDVAEKWHLDFIGGFIGQERVLASFDTGVFFGFEGAYQSGTFGDANNPETGAFWFNGNSYNASTSKILNDEQYLRVIKARIIKNNSQCSSINDLVEIINLLTGSTDNSVYLVKHGHLQARVNDKDGLLAYFLSRQFNNDNILPIPLGVRFEIVE
jgi:hypothetical protein